jgi:calcium/calmodulin-dependent protein kinase I
MWGKKKKKKKSIAKVVDEQDALSTLCGSPGYVAPEVIQKNKYSYPVDMWAFG